MDDIRKRAQQMQEERRENKCQVTIIHKATGQVVERADKYYDEAESWARGRISSKPELKYKIYT